MTLVDEVADRLRALTDDGASCLVAVSGGPDSVALLDLLHRGTERHGRRLVVGHVDHGIGADSGEVATVVGWLAKGRGLPFISRALKLGAETTETRARTARRKALREMAGKVGADAIVLGHHADDQIETVLLRLLRGSGPAGLAGMAERAGVWVRPLLGVRREALAGYLVEQGIAAWHDPANTDPRHLRSWLRGSILPTVAARLPDVGDRLLEAGRQAREARTGWDQLVEAAPELALRAEPDGFSVAAPPLRGYRSALRSGLVRALGRRAGVPLGRRRLAAIQRLLAGTDGEITLAPTLVVELAFDRLQFRRPAPPPTASVPIPAGGATTFGALRFEAHLAPAAPAVRDGVVADFTPGEYHLRAWQSGDRIRPLRGSGSRAVAELLREARVPPGRRPHWPVVVAADATIVWVPGICRSDACIPTEGSEALRVRAVVA